MPIDIRQIKSDLYVLRWHGQITIDEVYASHEQTTHIAQQAGIDQYIHVIDMADMTSFPHNVAAAIKIIRDHPNIAAALLVGIQPSMRIMVKLINHMMPHIILKEMDTVDHALYEAKALLEQERI